MIPKAFSGARAIVSNYDKNTGLQKVVGIFNSFNYGVAYNAQAVYILGRFSPDELDYTSVEPVNITAGAWRVINHGPHTDGRLPPLNTLLTTEYVELSVVDRATGQTIAKIHGCRPTGYSAGATARQLSETSNTYMGLLLDDEDTTNAEDPSAASLPG